MQQIFKAYNVRLLSLADRSELVFPFLVWVCLLIFSAMSCIGRSYLLRLITLDTELRFGLAAPGPDSFISFKPSVRTCAKVRGEHDCFLYFVRSCAATR